MQKHESPWDSSTFLHFSAFGISSGSDKCHLQDLTSDLAKKQGSGGEHILYAVTKNPKLEIPGIVGLFE